MLLSSIDILMSQNVRYKVNIARFLVQCGTIGASKLMRRDFLSGCVKSTVRTIYYCRVERRGELLELKVCANGFLYNMVRAITGTVLYAAEGKLLPEDIPAILDSGNRTLAGPTAPPGGLYLTRVWYEDERLNGTDEI